jgi:hypothetical protein
MNRQEARMEALRNIASNARSDIDAGFEASDNEDEEKSIIREMCDIIEELLRRASQIEHNLTLKPKRSKK